MKSPVNIPIAVFHILMKFLPFMLTHEVVISYSIYEQHPYICKAISLIMFCYAAGSCLWDYFMIKKIKAGEEVNPLLPLIIDAVQFIIAAVMFIKHFMLLEEVYAYDNFFQFMKHYFEELRPR